MKSDKLRRADKSIEDVNRICAILQKAQVCRLGLCDEDRPYIIPLNYGYKWEANGLNLFFHSAVNGKKIDIIKKNPNGCFEIDIETKLIESDNPCDFSMKYESVIAKGKITILENEAEKTEALNIIMKHYTDSDNWNFKSGALEKVTVMKMKADVLTAKGSMK